MLRVAIVGCGKIADAHVEEVGKIAGARVAAVCDRELLMAEQLAVRYGVASHYDDFARLLDEIRPDVVHITTPPQSHLALARSWDESAIAQAGRARDWNAVAADIRRELERATGRSTSSRSAS